jgi:hypothetical protein
MTLFGLDQPVLARNGNNQMEKARIDAIFSSIPVDGREIKQIASFYSANSGETRLSTN